MNNTIEIMDTTKICRNFPVEPPQEILRESFLDTIHQLFEKYSIVVVEGREGIGKTTLLAQFASQLSNSSISIFVTPATQSSYDPDSIRANLLNQASWILNQKEIDSEELEKLDIKTQWEFKQTNLQRKAKSEVDKTL
jgi:ABC-type phosphate/phosphonate transport system ATPase subunit